MKIETTPFGSSHFVLYNCSCCVTFFYYFFGTFSLILFFWKWKCLVVGYICLENNNICTYYVSPIIFYIFLKKLLLIGHHFRWIIENANSFPKANKRLCSFITNAKERKRIKLKSFILYTILLERHVQKMTKEIDLFFYCYLKIDLFLKWKKRR